jgi:HSP20 family protein
MITRYDPLRQALSLRRAMDQLFEQSFVNPGIMPGATAQVALMDVSETPNGYEVDVALPGARPEDIELTVDQNTLTIRGRYSRQNEHEDQMQGQQQAERHNGGQQTQQGTTDRHARGYVWLLKEIPSGTFERTITFAKPIDVNKIQPSYQNGILTVQLPISEERRPKRISITGGQSQAQQVPVEARQQAAEAKQQQQR